MKPRRLSFGYGRIPEHRLITPTTTGSLMIEHFFQPLPVKAHTDGARSAAGSFVFRDPLDPGSTVISDWKFRAEPSE